MCGIIGYTGVADAIARTAEGLCVLEYRGYDSVGIAAQTADGIRIAKCRGRVPTLREKLPTLGDAHTAIGHTRWATHGAPSDANAHPHRVGGVTLVHNGIIENEQALRAALAADAPIDYQSETDTEVAAACLATAYARCGDPICAIRSTIERITGSYAFAILFDGHPDTVYAVRRGSPLLLAHDDSGSYLASDITAFLPFTRDYAPLEEGVIAVLTPQRVRLIDGNRVFSPVWQTTTLSPDAAEKGGYAHFMLKEMHEEPDAIRAALSPRIRDGLPCLTRDGIPDALWQSLSAVQIVACGSAMHAGLYGARLFEDIAGIPTTVHIASEYRYHPPIALSGTLVLVISQSGETADSLAALRNAKERGLSTLAIVNVVESSIAREADRRLYTYAGPEIAVATTKGYATQAALLALLAYTAAHQRARLSNDAVRDAMRILLDAVPRAVKNALVQADALTPIAERLAKREHIFYIGRGVDAALAEEGALKLKEISYIHAEAYPAGELKHGTISLIEAGTPVIALCTEAALREKMRAGIREVESRGADVIVLGDGGNERDALPRYFSALAEVQMLAYTIARIRGCDIDRPRNLAKSVTVE